MIFPENIHYIVQLIHRYNKPHNSKFSLAYYNYLTMCNNNTYIYYSTYTYYNLPSHIRIIDDCEDKHLFDFAAMKLHAAF